MGQDCCTNRFKTQIFSNSQNQVDTTSAFIQTTFDPFKNSLSISFLYLLTGKQVDIKMILELSEQQGKKHVCCYFDPDFLQRKYNLIEYQSLGSSLLLNNLADVFQDELDYLYDEQICNEILQFKVILVVETQGKGRHALSIIRCMDPSRGNCFIVYDHYYHDKIYRERVFQDEKALKKFLNNIGQKFFTSYSPSPISIKLLTFGFSDDKTESDTENLVNNNSQLTNNNIVNQYSFHSIQSQQQMPHSSAASIQQQQQQNQTPLQIQLQQLPSIQRNSSNTSSISSHNAIRSFQSLNQQNVSLPIKLQRNSSQNIPSEQEQIQILKQCQQQFLQTKYQSSEQLTSQQIVTQLKQINQNWIEIKNDNFLQQQTLMQSNNQNSLNNLNLLPTPPTIHSNQNCGGGIIFFSNNNLQNNIASGNILPNCTCAFPKKGNQIELNYQIQNDLSWEQENFQQEGVIHFCNNHGNEDVEVQDDDQCPSSASVQFNYDEIETPQHFHFPNTGHCGAEDNDFLSDDASEIQICIQSANELD